MLNWAITFLILSLIAGVLGFGGVAAISIDFARVLFFIFIVLFLIASIAHAMRGKFPKA